MITQILYRFYCAQPSCALHNEMKTVVRRVTAEGVIEQPGAMICPGCSLMLFTASTERVEA